MSSGSFHVSDLVQAIRQLNVVKLLGYRDFVAYISSLGVSLMKLDDFDDMVYINGGSYTSTYRTVHRDSAKPVAFKTPLNSLSRADGQLEKEAHHQALSSIIQEIRILAHSSLSMHPNLPRILGVSIIEDSQQDGISPCIVQELAIMDLEQYLSTDDAIPKLDTLPLIPDIAGGICALHAYHLVHGDIHPKNILLFQDQGAIRAKVADLGTCGAEFASEFIPGTRDFWAPECHPRSPFHKAHMNGSARDVYTFGLLINHLISRSYRNTPFPRDQQFEIQHDQDRSLQQLARRRVDGLFPGINDDVAADAVGAQLVPLVSQIVRVNPSDRPTISTLCRELRSIFNLDNIQEIAEKLIQQTLISDPEDPRIRTVGQLDLPAGVVSRLTSEYRVAARETRNPKIAIYMATLYAGAVGVGLEVPWNVIAQIQWLFKAAELGFYSSLLALRASLNVMRIIAEHGKKPLFVKHPTFESPSIDMSELIRQLRLFAAMPDESALILLECLGEAPCNSQDGIVGIENETRTESKNRVRSALPHLFIYESLTLNRTWDAAPIDSDAFDHYILGDKGNLEIYAYSNSLESLMAAIWAVRFTRQSGDKCMQFAILGGSYSVAEYLLKGHNIRGDRVYEGTSHVELSILYNRLDILSLFLKTGVDLKPAEGNTISVLHLAARHDNREMISMLCGHLQAIGSLQSVLESSTSDGENAHYAPIYMAMNGNAFTNVVTFLDFGANPEAGYVDGERLIHRAVEPHCPGTPLFVLTRLIEAGADLNVTNKKYQTPLHTAVGSSNILAVYHLLTAGADCSLLSDAGETAIEEAENIARSMQVEGPIETLNEEGELCESGYDHCCSASKYIVAMVAVATVRSDGWKESLRQIVQNIEGHVKNKMWIVDSFPVNFYVQIEVPD